MSELKSGPELETIITNVRPEHTSVQRYDGGDNRDVLVVDGHEAFRFPKDASGIEVGRYEFAALQLLQDKLTIEIPRPIELAADGSYNVLSFLKGKVLSKYDFAKLPYKKSRDIAVAIAGVINELNTVVTQTDITSIPSIRSIKRQRDDYYTAVYKEAQQQQSHFAHAYRNHYEQLQHMRPGGSASNIIVFGDFSSPNLILSDDFTLTGIIDWTEFGIGDIHNELRPVFSVIGQPAFQEMVAAIDTKLGPINQDLVRTLATVHELGVLVHGKERGVLTPERTQLAMTSLDSWLQPGWAAQT